VNGLLQILAPFFVAALALVAGFPGDALDQPMGGLPPYLLVAGERYFPTRRELLGYLFAYLAGLSVLTYLGGGTIIAALNPAPNPIALWFAVALNGYLRLCMKAAYGALLIHLFAVTLLGLHFLGNYLASSRVRDRPRSHFENPTMPPQTPVADERYHQPPEP